MTMLTKIARWFVNYYKSFECKTLGSVSRCEIYKLPAKVGATIEIRTRLWNSTLAEDYLDIDVVEIYSKARVVVDADISQVIF